MSVRTLCLVLLGTAVLLYVAYVGNTWAIAAHNARQPAVSQHAVLPLNDDAWHEGPQGMPAGARFAVVSGDPTQSGPFVLRAELPPGYSIEPYRRSFDESIVVLTGTVRIGDGSSFDPSRMRQLDSGAFVRLRANEPHFAATHDGAVVQIIGTGPFTLEYVRVLRASL